MSGPAAYLTQIVGVSTEPVAIDEVMATDSVDVRGLDLFPLLSPLGDTLAAVGNLLVLRQDCLPCNAADLTITPAGYAYPWLSANAAGVPAMAINWFQGVGPAAQLWPLTDGEVVYLIVVNVTTANGRSLALTASQVVTPTTS